MRRLIVEDPVSRPAVWSARVGLVALAAFAFSAILTRTSRLDLDGGLAALAASAGLALVALGLALLAFVRIWMHGHRGFGIALGGVALAALVLAYPAAIGARSAIRPPVFDVSTDLESAPAFATTPSVVAARGGWRGAAAEPALRARQRAEATRIAPLVVELPEDTAFTLATRAAADIGMQVLESVPPGEEREAGTIDGRTTTLLLRLPVEIAVRVRPSGEGARVDIRAVSRAPVDDLGGPTETVRAFLAAFEERRREGM